MAMTGLNPTMAKTRIEDFNGEASALQREIMTLTTDFFAELSQIWFSPKAIEFQDIAVAAVDDFNRELVYLIESIVNDSCEAFNAIATSNGIPSILIETGPFASLSYTKLLEMDPEGNVVIDVSQTRTLTDNFTNSLSGIMKSTNNLAKDIALYDPEGNLARIFALRIDKFCKYVDENIKIVNKELNDKIDEQITVATEGVQKAQENLGQ